VLKKKPNHFSVLLSVISAVNAFRLFRLSANGSLANVRFAKNTTPVPTWTTMRQVSDASPTNCHPSSKMQSYRE